MVWAGHSQRGRGGKPRELWHERRPASAVSACWPLVGPVARRSFSFRRLLPDWPQSIRETKEMRLFGFRAMLVALMAVAVIGTSSAARADSGSIRISVLKGGWFI